jgi:pimeloyl-ACP methyl ester carboxylesterase
MSGEAAAAVGTRFEVRSADGTSLAVWVEGQGPPLVLVHGSMCDHTAFDPLVAELREDMTTFAMDAAGSGRAATRPATRSSGSSRTSPPWWRRWRPGPAGRWRCGTTRTGPAAPWARPP